MLIYKTDEIKIWAASASGYRCCPLFLTDRMKEDYTTVLKAHIAVARAEFAPGTMGAEIDAGAALHTGQNVNNRIPVFSHLIFFSFIQVNIGLH